MPITVGIVDEAVPDLLRTAARAVAAAGLSDAFGHVSMRTGPTAAVITPPVPLGAVGPADDPVPLALDLSAALPAAAPKEAWMHVAVMDAATGGVCRAQPPSVAALAALDIPVPVLSGHTAMLGTIVVHDDSRLVRDADSARRVAESLGDGRAIVLRGNGALTRGLDLASAVAAMWVLERAADTALRALAAGTPRELPAEERAWWREHADELLPRIASYLFTRVPDGEESP